MDVAGSDMVRDGGRIGKRLRGYVLMRFQRFRTFAHGNVKNRLTWKQKKQLYFLILAQRVTLWLLVF